MTVDLWRLYTTGDRDFVEFINEVVKCRMALFRELKR